VAERAPKAFAASRAWQQLPPLNGVQGLELLVLTAAAVDTTSDAAAAIDPNNNNSPACQLQAALVQVLATVNSRDDTVWELLVQAAEDVPVLLQGAALPRVWQFCLASSSLLAVQVVVLLLMEQRQHHQTPTETASALRAVLEHSLATCWNALVEIDADADAEQEWATEAVPLHHDGVVVDDSNDQAEFGQALLTELLRAAGGALALPILLPVVERALNQEHGDCRVQRAALAALECAATAVPHQLGPHVAAARQAAVTALAQQSSSYRVQYQAVRLLGVLCETTTDPAATMAATEMLEPLARATHSPCPKIAAMACQAITSYCRSSSGGGGEENNIESTVVPYLSDVLQALVTGPLRSGGDIGVQVRAVGAVACLAQVTGAAFAGFYGQVMPGLLQLVNQSSGGNSFASQQLAGASLEAATIVGQALGEEQAHLFAPDAQRILQQAVPILQQQQTPTIPMDQLLAACARIASVMGEAYAPYVQVVLPHLLQRAADPADVEFSVSRLFAVY